MDKTILDHVNNFYKQTSRLTYKTIEQSKADFKIETNAISKIFVIDDLEAMFLLSIISNNASYKNCQIEDIADNLDISKFEVLKNYDKIIALQNRNLIQISEPDENSEYSHRYSHRFKFPISVLNKIFKISNEVELRIFSTTI